MSVFKVFNKMSLQSEYKQLLKDINPLISNLDSAKDAKLCAKWLSKLDDVNKNEWALRNELLRFLKECLMNKKLAHPFSETPSDAFLHQVIPNLTLRSTTVGENDASSHHSSDLICQYQERSRKYKSAISNYQNILKDLLELSVEDTARVCGQGPGGCGCRPTTPLADGPAPMLNIDIMQRVSTIENEIMKIREKNFQEELKKSNGSLRERRRRKGKNKSMEHFKKLIKTTDSKISQLESDLRETTLKDLNSGHSQLEKNVMERCNELEKKYQHLMNTLAEQHKKERDADRKIIESYQKLTLTHSHNQEIQ